MSKKILVIDDEADVRTFLSAVLKKGGYEVLLAEDGAKGLEMARLEKPDLVTLDLQMPQKTGTDFYRKFSRDKEFASIPVIVVSGLPGRHLALRKPAAVFDKPINPDKFLAAIEEALR